MLLYSSYWRKLLEPEQVDVRYLEVVRKAVNRDPNLTPQQSTALCEHIDAMKRQAGNTVATGLDPQVG